MKKKLLKAVFILFALGFLSGLGILGLIIYISFDLPQINSLADYNPPIPSKIYSKDGEVLLELGKEQREIARFEEIPQKVVQCFVAAEDDNFYNHSGVDYMGIVRAMVKNIRAGRIVQGGSTLTQQVAKSLLLSSERTYSRKIKDLLLAKRIEEKFTKDEILYLYLNQVYLGGGYYGVKAAFKGYFDKELGEATVAECALIAGLLVAPGKYSPYVNPQYAKKRQTYVLGRLFKTGKISQLEYDVALKENIRMKLKESNPFKAGYFTDWIRQKLIKRFGTENFLTNGYEVVTTIDWGLQQKAEEEVLKGVKEVDKRQGFKGPIGFWDSAEQIQQEFIKFRKKTYKEESNFFTFNADGTTEYEFTYTDGEVEKIVEKDEASIEEVKARNRKYFIPGQNMEDPFIKFVTNGENYRAVVTDVNDSQRMVYVQFGGLKAVIPYEHFRWAHERNITEEKNYWSYVTRPSTILKKGDIVLIELKASPRSIWEFIWSDFKKKITGNKDLINLIKSQKYFIAALDQKPEAQGALLSVSPRTGEILSLVGGYSFKESQFNRVVQSNRQPGSAFKPMLFAVGLENGYTPSSVLMDSPQALAAGIDQTLQWKPRNYDGKFKGEMTFRRALETSRNIPTIRLVQDVGVTNILNFVERLKLNAKLPPDLSISLGSFGMNLLDLVKAYAIFPNGGRILKLKSVLSIKDRFGKVYLMDEEEEESDDEEEDGAKLEPVPEVVEQEDNADKKEGEEAEGEGTEELEEEKQNPFLVNLNEEQVYDTRLAFIMTNLMKGIVSHGTGRRARDIGTFIGGKTGTTNNYVDAWFIGFSSDIVTGVWTGFDDNKTLGWGETGAKAALPIWRAYMQAGLQKLPERDFTPPAGIINVAVNRDSGKLASSTEKQPFMESFVEGTEPGSVKEEPTKEDQGIVDTILEDDDIYDEE
jgi:penicillin-binding protein 1A